MMCLPRYHRRHLRVCDGEDIDAKFPHLPRFIVRVSPDRSPLAISPQRPGVPYRTTFCKGVRLGKFGIPTERLSQRTTRWFVEIAQSGRRNTRVTPAPLTQERSRVKRTVSSAILCTALCRRSSFSSRVRDLETGPAVFLPIVPASLLHLHY